MSEPCHALVFRDAREQLCLRTASQAIRHDLIAFQHSQDKDLLISALLRAGEMEGALTDVAAEAAAIFTGSLAWALVEPAKAHIFATAAQHTLQKIPLTSTQYASRPEGFAFYGLHPLDYADAAVKLDFSGDGPIIVIGVRTIGYTLGEVVAASLRVRLGAKRSVQSISVRPTGHPYDRTCTFTTQQTAEIRECGANVQIIIVDEGPGMSGSSFLSVGEAVVALGVNPSQITFLCSRDVDPSQLVTPNGADRWEKFRKHVTQRNHSTPEAAAVAVIAGAWRSSSHLWETLWPGLWTSMLPAAFCSADGKSTFEYHGLGRYGDAVRDRLNDLAEACFTLPVTRAANGFSRIPAVAGCRFSKYELSCPLIERVAEYLAFRAQAFAVKVEPDHTTNLEAMARFNFQQATGRELPEDFKLPLHHPTISDSQMMPHTWFKPFAQGPLLKLDCGTHGDNHFYPGPVDSAWDVAGAIIEWEMHDAYREYFVAWYDKSTQDDVGKRLQPYMIAYAAFRNGYCRMAASAMSGDPAEQERLLRDARRYCAWLQRLVPEKTLAVSGYE